MSSLRQGILRAVRLLPDVVKIGLEPKAARPAVREEEPVPAEKRARVAEPPLKKDSVDLSSSQVQLPAQSPPSVQSRVPVWSPSPPAGQVPTPSQAPAQSPGPVPEQIKKEDLADPLKELKNQMESLQKSLSDAAASRAELMEKKASVEADLARVKEAAAQREREMAESIEAAKEQARVEGKTLGHAEGLENGYQEGLKKAGIEVAEQYREKFTGLTDRLEGFSTKLDARFSELVALNEPRMLRLWQEMLEKMLQREMALEPDGVLDALSGVLARLSDKSRVLIYVAPEDLDLLDQSLQGEFGDVLRNVKHLELKSDANVDRGSCIVETNLGVYDARWRTQFDQIDTEIENLFQKLGKPPKPKETARRIRKRDRAENTAPQPEQARFGQAQPEQTQSEQTQPERTQSERTQPEPARPEQPRLKPARSEQAVEKPKPAARKRASSKRGKIEEDAV